MSENKKTSKLKYILIFWILFLVVILTPVVLIGMASLGFFGKLPELEELENPKSNLASEVISVDDQILGKYYVENRVNVRFNQISPYVTNALVATEDARFYDHSGIDYRSLGRVLFKTVVGGDKSSGGGSTITQQLAKMLFHERSGGLVERAFQKLKEWIIAVQLEKRYTKQEIITMYLNKFDFINNAVGIKTASRTYFDVSPDSLNILEAATLVGMAKNPALFNPVRRNEMTQQRRNVVLYQMTQYKNSETNKPYLTREEYDSLKVLPLELKFQREDHNQGSATYFREFLRGYMAEWIKNNPKPDGTSYSLYKDGLKIYTTIDSRMQKYAEEAVQEHLTELQDEFFRHWKDRKTAPYFRLTDEQIEKMLTQSMKRSERYSKAKTAGKTIEEIKKEFNVPVEMAVYTWRGDKDTLMTPWDSIRYYKHFLQVGFMSMDPANGHIKAWIGGINYEKFKYDHVKQSRRQVGSTFKPLVYALAMQEFWSPCLEVPNVPVSFNLPTGQTWTPKNSDNKYGGMLSLKKGLATSTNTVTAFIMKQFGPQAVIDLVRKMGITSPIDAVPSICLGTPDLSVYELVGANSTFANKGVWVEPMFITRIEDKNGVVLQEFIPRKNEAISEEAAYLTLNLMQGVVEHGTGVRLRYKYGLNTKIAGKTGTTQNNSDGWFVGLTPELVSGVWVGCEDRAAHFRSTALGQGANMALPIWAKYMQKVYADARLDISQGDFERPKNKIEVELDCDKYKKTNNHNFNDRMFDNIK
jgi:penicillin-binding protein 1A